MILANSFSINMVKHHVSVNINFSTIGVEQAAHLMSNASAHDRQAMNPIYDGQEVVCMSKAEIIRAIADKLLAEAELIEAHAA